MQKARSKPADTPGRSTVPVRNGSPEPRRRLAPEDREHQIVQAAIAFFARRGFDAGTRELAQELGVTQPLLYRYFPTKEALVDRVYDEVFVSRWNPEWEEWLADRSAPLADRLKRYFKDYARFVLRSESRARSRSRPSLTAVNHPAFANLAVKRTSHRSRSG